MTNYEFFSCITGDYVERVKELLHEHPELIYETIEEVDYFYDDASWEYGDDIVPPYNSVVKYNPIEYAEKHESMRCLEYFVKIKKLKLEPSTIVYIANYNMDECQHYNILEELVVRNKFILDFDIEIYDLNSNGLIRFLMMGFSVKMLHIGKISNKINLEFINYILEKNVIHFTDLSTQDQIYARMKWN